VTADRRFSLDTPAFDLALVIISAIGGSAIMKLRILAIGMPVLVLTTLISASWKLSSIMMRHLPDACDKALYIFCGSPQEQGLTFHDFTIVNKDQTTLSGWWIPADDSSKVIILSHGHGGNRREGMRYAKALHDAGYGVIAFDYRYVLQNQGATDTMSWNERRELSSVVSYAKSLGANHVGVYGISQGGATAIMAMAQDPRIEAAALEASFANASEATADIFRHVTALPAFPIVNLAMEIFAMRSGLPLSGLDPEAAIGQLMARPLYLIHDRQDPEIGFRHSERLAKLAPTAQTWFYDYGHHAQSWQFDRAKAEKQLVKFFDTAFTGPLARTER
jgi:uncharacterized protein